MFKLKYKREDCYSVNFLKNGNTIISGLNGLQLFNNQEFDLTEIRPKGININDNKILISLNFLGDKLLLDNHLNIINKFNSGEDGVECLVNENNFIHIFYSSDYSKSYFGLYDIKKSKNSWHFESGINKSYFFKNSFIINFLNKVIYISIDNGSALWQFSNLSNYNWIQKSIYENEPSYLKEAEVIKFLGVYKNLLWIVLNSGSLLALDSNSGKAKKHIHQGKPNKEVVKPLNNAWFLYDTFIDEKEGKINNLNQDFYLEYDLEKEEDFFEYSTFSESSVQFGLELNKIAGYDEENIYAYEGGDNNRFAIFSREKKEIVWSGEIEEVKGQFPALLDVKYSNNKLYVLDKKNTLHIFEKE